MPIVSKGALSTILAVAAICSIDAFAPLQQRHHTVCRSSPLTPLVPLPMPTSVCAGTRLFASEGDASSKEDASANADAKADDTASEGETAASDEAEPEAEAAPAEEEEKEAEEDPEVTALKKQITDLETALSGKKTTLQYTSDKADEFSKAGYARKVAEMQNTRRIRNSLDSTGRSSSKAAVLKEFLPIYDKLSELKVKYEADEFGSKYGGLTLSPTFESMGVTSFDAEAGSEVNQRIKVVSSEVSAEFPKDTVIKQTLSGLELEGNILREAECITSLGAENEPAPEEKEESSDSGSDTNKEKEA